VGGEEVGGESRMQSLEETGVKKREMGEYLGTLLRFKNCGFGSGGHHGIF
jgi:hypothetical protein